VSKTNFYLGWDTEYADSSNLITTQLYIHGYFIAPELPNWDDLLAIYHVKKIGTVFIFLDSFLKPGLSYTTSLSKRLFNIINFFGLKEMAREFKPTVCTFYSNEELSNLFPTKNDLQELMKAQGDCITDHKTSLETNLILID
jgi:hypothetical protein